jgi:hypothetical protein
MPFEVKGSLIETFKHYTILHLAYMIHISKLLILYYDNAIQSPDLWRKKVPAAY